MGKSKKPKRTGKWMVAEEEMIPDITPLGNFKDEAAAVRFAEQRMAGGKGTRQSRRVWRIRTKKDENPRLLTVKFFPDGE